MRPTTPSRCARRQARRGTTWSPSRSSAGLVQVSGDVRDTRLGRGGTHSEHRRIRAGNRETLVAVEFLSAETLEVQRLEAADLELEYRNSALIKSGSLTGLVLSVELRLRKADGQSAPIRYGQLAMQPRGKTGDRRPLADVRRSVLELRASKGMVLSDAPTRSRPARSSTNPIVSKAFTHSLPKDAPRFAAAPKTRADGGETEAFKLSAAWLIERAGIEKGFSLGTGRAAISSKHTLAITNTGGATGEEVAELARYVQIRVSSEFGVQLVNEPVLVGLEI